MAKKSKYENINPGYLFVSKYTNSQVGSDGEMLLCDVGDLCIVLEKRLNNAIIEPDPKYKYTFVIQNLDRKITFTVSRGFPSHIPVDSKLAATLYC